jgi:hypothetical protein
MRNEKSSAPTSLNERRLEVELSEADYLAREIVDAKSALSHALADLKSGVANSTDLRKWVQHYPWAALAAALATGFAAAAAVTPAPGESVSDKLARSRPNGRPCTGDQPAGRPPSEESHQASNITHKLVSALFDVAKVFVKTLIVTAFQRPNANEQPATAGDEP